jgi:hypothetical protein
LPKFVEQPRVLNGDDGLSGKIFEKFYLFIGERPDFGAMMNSRRLIRSPRRRGPVSTTV